MSKFRKKPVVIEAKQIRSYLDIPSIVRWIESNGGKATYGQEPDEAAKMLVSTPEGVMTAWVGNWIIRGVAGEFYPCKPDIFAATYEPVVEIEFCDICPHAVYLHNPDGSCGCGMDCASERKRRTGA